MSPHEPEAVFAIAEHTSQLAASGNPPGPVESTILLLLIPVVIGFGSFWLYKFYWRPLVDGRRKARSTPHDEQVREITARFKQERYFVVINMLETRLPTSELKAIASANGFRYVKTRGERDTAISYAYFEEVDQDGNPVPVPPGPERGAHRLSKKKIR